LNNKTSLCGGVHTTLSPFQIQNIHSSQVSRLQSLRRFRSQPFFSSIDYLLVKLHLSLITHHIVATVKLLPFLSPSLPTRLDKLTVLNTGAGAGYRLQVQVQVQMRVLVQAGAGLPAPPPQQQCQQQCHLNCEFVSLRAQTFLCLCTPCKSLLDLPCSHRPLPPHLAVLFLPAMPHIPLPCTPCIYSSACHAHICCCLRTSS
jgi:hypothetical protein